MNIRFCIARISILLFVFCISFSTNCVSQGPVLEWAGRMGGVGNDHANAVVIDTAGYLFVAGSFESIVDMDPGNGIINLISAGETDVFILKFTPAGSLVWAKQMGGAGADSLTAMKIDSQGNLLLTGTFTGTADFDPSSAVYNLVSSGFSSQALNAFIVKMDSNGNLIMATAIQCTYNIISNSIASDSSGNILVSGRFIGTADFELASNLVYNVTASGFSYDIYMIKVDHYGNTIWFKIISNSGGAININAITMNSNNDLIIVGSFAGIVDFNPGAGINNLVAYGNDLFVLALDNDGNFEWAKKVTGSDDQFGGGITTDFNNNVYITGYFENVTDFDPSSATYNIQAVGYRDAYVLKLNQYGGFLWVKTFAGYGNETGFAITTDNSGKVYSTGSFTDSTDFDPGAGTFWLNGIANAYISCLDSSGNMLWTEMIEGNQTMAGQDIAVYYGLYIYTVGYFKGLIDLDPGLGSINSYSNGINDGYVLKLKPAISSSMNQPYQSNALIYPNPANNSITLSQISSKWIRILNYLGQEVYYQKIAPGTSAVNIAIVPFMPGIYFIVAENFTFKFTKM